MQSNCDDLLHSHTRWQATRSGSLHVLLSSSGGGKSSSSAKSKLTSSKSDQSSANQCHCRLVGNLLFISHYRGIDPLPVPQDCDYLVVLEACKLEIDYSTAATTTAGYAFRLVFDYESQTILFRAASEADRSAWVTAIQEASVFEKLDSAEATRQRIMAITGHDPLEPAPMEPMEAAEGSLQIAGQPGEGSGDPDRGPATGGLELDLACRSLPPLRPDSSLPHEFPNAHVEVHARMPPLQEDWAFVGRTDVAENCRDPLFRKLVVIPEGQYSEESSFLRFDIFDVRDQSSRTMRPLYSVQAGLRQLEICKEIRLSDTDAATLLVRIRRRSDQLGPSKNRHWILLRHLCTEQRLMSSHLYKFAKETPPGSDPSYSAQLTVMEFMCDLKCGMHVPLQMATHELSRLRTLEAAMSSLGEHNCPPSQPDQKPLYRLSQSEKLLLPQVSALCQEFLACVDETNRRLFDGEFLKLSRLRHSQQLAFVPPNLQLHRLAVVDSREKPLDYLDIVSHGAPAAHYLKFKKGGLLSAFKSAPGLEDALDVCDKAISLLHEGNQLCDQLTRLLTGVQLRRHQQQQQQQLSSVSTLIASADSERVTELVTRLIFLASDCLIVQTRIALELGSVGMQQLNRLLLAATAAADLEQRMTPAACDRLLAEVTSVWLQCRLTLARLWLSEAAKFPPDALLHCHRRRATSFSQMVTAVVCGVAAHFARWSEATWRQMEACGIPVYMQSLLSAYKSEGGMLEDLAATVPRLANVTVAFFPGSTGDQPVVEDGARRVRICVPQQLWDRLSSSLDSLLRGHSFRLVPMLFNVGINEQQTLAETKRVASLAVQRDLNKRSAATLRSLVDQMIRHRRNNNPTLAATSAAQFDGNSDERSLEQTLRDSLQQVDLCIEEDKSKPVLLLHTVEVMFWMIDGVRLTNCKSGKDRTAMGVTLEQARWLREMHGLKSDRASFDSTVAFLRTHGLRRRNCFRNIGSTYYAFNRVQLHTFPQMYRPPKGTYERGPT